MSGTAAVPPMTSGRVAVTPVTVPVPEGAAPQVTAPFAPTPVTYGVAPEQLEAGKPVTPAHSTDMAEGTEVSGMRGSMSAASPWNRIAIQVWLAKSASKLATVPG